MLATIDDVPVHYVEHGSGAAVLALHGSYSAHQEVEDFLELLFRSRPEYQRIYPDLPGMGNTPAPARIRSSNDVMEVLLAYVDEVIGDEPFLVVGHSAGGYLGRGIANRRPDRVAGLALICPLTAEADHDEHHALEAADDLDVELTQEQEAEFRGYFVIQTPATARRFLAAVGSSDDGWLVIGWPASGLGYDADADAWG